MNEAKYKPAKQLVSFDFGTKDNSRYLKINFPNKSLDTGIGGQSIAKSCSNVNSNIISSN